LLTDLSGCRASLYFPSPIPHPRPRRFDDERRIPRGRRPGPAEAGLALTKSRGKYLFAIWIGVHSVRLGLAAVCPRSLFCGGDDDDVDDSGPCWSMVFLDFHSASCTILLDVDSQPLSIAFSLVYSVHGIALLSPMFIGRRHHRQYLTLLLPTPRRHHGGWGVCVIVHPDGTSLPQGTQNTVELGHRSEYFSR
jgi:hypothetical protein